MQKDTRPGQVKRLDMQGGDWNEDSSDKYPSLIKHKSYFRFAKFYSKNVNWNIKYCSEKNT